MDQIDLSNLTEPSDFDKKCRQKGKSWLQKHPNPCEWKSKRPCNYWKDWTPALGAAYHNRCAYSAMLTLDGAVDHFIPISKDPNLAYEWSNYRYSSHMMNCFKGDSDVLDPLFVKEGWFKIILPSLQLVVDEEKIPEKYKAIAGKTLEKLHLIDDERVIRQREAWFNMYQQGLMTLECLYLVASLIAKAVERERRQKKGPQITQHLT